MHTRVTLLLSLSALATLSAAFSVGPKSAAEVPGEADLMPNELDLLRRHFLEQQVKALRMEDHEEAKRAYKSEGDAYIRFGKRRNANKMRRAPAESTYIRFGKRAMSPMLPMPPMVAGGAGGDATALTEPCTLQRFMTLPTRVDVLRHLHECILMRDEDNIINNNEVDGSSAHFNR